MKEKNGFTLIELLAVIVILAIIAIIATPIVLNIISDSKESAQLRGAEFYLDAVEYSIANSVLDNNPMIDGIYDVLETGNLCLEYDENKTCLNERAIELDGEKPKGGYVIIDEGQIIESRMTYEGNSVLHLEDGSSFISDYEIGEELVFNAGDKYRTWNVIGETENKVTLMLSENFNYGTKPEQIYISSVFQWLNSFSSLMTIDVIDNFTYSNKITEKKLESEKVKINKGIETIIDGNGVETILTGEAKARLITVEELLKIIQIQNPYFRDINLEYLLGMYLKQEGNETSAKDYMEEQLKTAKEYELIDEKLYTYALASQTLSLANNSTHVFLPEWLGNNLSEGDGYYTMTYTLTLQWFGTYCIYFSEDVGFLFWVEKPNEDDIGYRPVIEISKDKLK